MSDPYYSDCFKANLDATFDSALLPLIDQGMSWLPWVGREYAQSRIMVVGESHYIDKKDMAEAQEAISQVMGDREYTREIIAENPIHGEKAGWKSVTFNNLHLTLVESALLADAELYKRQLLWRNMAYMNLVQRPMNYAFKERPNHKDFIGGWPVLLMALKILQPVSCIFIGVTAADKYIAAMRRMSIAPEEVRRGEKLNNCYARGPIILSSGTSNTKAVFLKHTSCYYSWGVWRKYLEEQIPVSLQCLAEVIAKPKPASPTETHILVKPSDNVADAIGVPVSEKNTDDDLRFMPFEDNEWIKDIVKRYPRQDIATSLEAVKWLALEVCSRKTKMPVGWLVNALNRLGYKTNRNTPYVCAGHGPYRLLKCAYDNCSGAQGKHAIAIAFCKPNGQYAYALN